MSVGERLRELRGDMTLEALERASGVSAPYISKLERDKALARRDKFVALLDVIGPDDELLLERDQAELEQLGYDPGAAKIIVKLGELDPETRSALIDRWVREAEEAAKPAARRTQLRVAANRSG